MPSPEFPETDAPPSGPAPARDGPTEHDLRVELEEARAEITRLKVANADLELLYEATIAHGEAVEDQLAESNLLLMGTQKRLNEDIAEASAYVVSLIPAPRTMTPTTRWLYVPSTELGGDFFGYHDIDDDHLAFYLIDVCGHGVGAALLSVTVINVLRASGLALTDFRDPSAVLGTLNDAFQMERHNNLYFTMWYGVYERSTGMLRYASAGHPPAILVRDAEAAEPTVFQLATPNLAVGVFPGTNYRSDAIAVEGGDRLLVLSDGAYEVERAPGEMLPLPEFVNFVAGPSDADPERILEWIRSFNGPGPLPDDFSLLRVGF
jgi:sigma-B regulation protein RsbU (phosphoserine phosphatase)